MDNYNKMINECKADMKINKKIIDNINRTLMMYKFKESEINMAMDHLKMRKRLDVCYNELIARYELELKILMNEIKINEILKSTGNNKNLKSLYRLKMINKHLLTIVANNTNKDNARSKKNKSEGDYPESYSSTYSGEFE